jgi:hypothetical protein
MVSVILTSPHSVNLFAGTFNSVLHSTTNGTSWAKVGWQQISFINALAAFSDTNIFVGSNYGIFLNTVNGTSWTDVSDGFVGETEGDSIVTALTVSGTYLFAGLIVV